MSDLIDRKEAIDAIHKEFDKVENVDCDGWEIANDIEECLKYVPTVEKKVVMKMKAVATGLTFIPNKHTGKWEERSVFEDSIQQWQSARCSVCEKYHTTPYLYYFDNFNYCPNCGAKMEVIPNE